MPTTVCPSGKNEGPASGCGLSRTQRFAHMHALTKTLAHFKGLFYMIDIKSTWKIAQLTGSEVCHVWKITCLYSGSCRRGSINEISSHTAWNTSSIKLFFRTRVVSFKYVPLKEWTWNFSGRAPWSDEEWLMTKVRGRLCWHGTIRGSEVTWHREEGWFWKDCLVLTYFKYFTW